MKTALTDLPFKVKFREVQYTGDGSVVVGVAKHAGLAQPFAFLSGEDLKVEGDVFPRSVGRVERSSWQDATIRPAPPSKFLCLLQRSTGSPTADLGGTR